MSRERNDKLCALPITGAYADTVNHRDIDGRCTKFRHPPCRICGTRIIWRIRGFKANGERDFIPTLHDSGEWHACRGNPNNASQEPVQTPTEPVQTEPVTIDIEAIVREVLARLPEPTIPTIDYDRIIDATTRALQSVTPTPISIERYNVPPVTIEFPHPSLSQLMMWIAARRNVWLFGPAGSGKTSAIPTIANALGLRYGIMSVGPMTQEFAITGYHSADGTFIQGAINDYYENGGVFLFDEIGNGSPDCMTTLNALLANGECMMGGRMVKKHPDFVAVAADNTNGNGASSQYTARSKQDAALLDRFEFLEWGYDAHLERRIASAYEHPDSMRWHDYVLQVRAACERLDNDLVVSTRAIISGCEGLQAGLTFEQVAQARFWNRLDSDAVLKIKASL